MEETPRRQAAHLVLVVAPPERPLRTGQVELGDISGLRKARIEAAHHPGDARVQAVPDDAAVLVLVEPEIQERFRKPAGL